MQICPKCNASYEDDLSECPQDGTSLEPAPHNLQKNPTIEDVIQVATHEMTAVVDLEKMEAMRLKALTQAQEHAANADPEATGTLLSGQDHQTQSGGFTQPADASLNFQEETTGVTQIDDSTDNIEPTEISQNHTQGSHSSPVTPSDREGLLTRQNTVFVIAGVLALSAFSIFIYVQSQSHLSLHASVLITTVPTQSEIWIDSQKRGESPLQLTLPPAFYDLEIKKDGYDSFRDIIELKAKGFTLAKSLKPKKNEDSKNKHASADELLERIHQTMSDEDLTPAWLNVKQFIQRYPDDPRILELLEKLGEQKWLRKQKLSQIGAKGLAKGSRNPAPWNQRFETAQTLMQKKEYDQAKVLLTILQQEKPKKAKPHRLLARITLAQNDIATTRYHLQQYLRLGGTDVDGQVKKWLIEHPPH
jgi:hypothetical protein